MRKVSGDDAAGRARVDALVEDLDGEGAAGQAPQRGRDPEALVVEAARVEAQHEAGRAEAAAAGRRRGRPGRGCRSPRWPR